MSHVQDDRGRWPPDSSPRSCKVSLNFLNTASLHLPTELQACRWLDEHVVSGCNMKVSICMLFVWLSWVCFSCSYSPEVFPVVFMLKQNSWKQRARAPGSVRPRLHSPSKRYQLQGPYMCPPDPRDPEEPLPLLRQLCGWDLRPALLSTEAPALPSLQGTCLPPPLHESVAGANCTECSTWSTSAHKGPQCQGCTVLTYKSHAAREKRLGLSPLSRPGN
jgi:hypothetical protein